MRPFGQRVKRRPRRWCEWCALLQVVRKDGLVWKHQRLRYASASRYEPCPGSERRPAERPEPYAPKAFSGGVTP